MVSGLTAQKRGPGPNPSAVYCALTQTLTQNSIFIIKKKTESARRREGQENTLQDPGTPFPRVFTLSTGRGAGGLEEDGPPTHP